MFFIFDLSGFYNVCLSSGFHLLNGVLMFQRLGMMWVSRGRITFQQHAGLKSAGNQTRFLALQVSDATNCSTVLEHILDPTLLLLSVNFD